VTEVATITLTPLEFETLRFVRLGLDPWNGDYGSSRSRVRSQALGRLQRKGLIQKDPLAPRGYALTPAGKDWLR
jgi:hypothetical protein